MGRSNHCDCTGMPQMYMYCIVRIATGIRMLINQLQLVFSYNTAYASRGGSESVWPPVCNMRRRRRACQFQLTAPSCHRNSEMAEALTKQPLSPSQT